MRKKIYKAILTAMTVLTCSLFFAFPVQAANVRTPVADGTVTYGTGNLTVDASHTADGYIMVKYSGRAPRVKVRIQKGTQYTYDLNTSGSYETFPLTEGNGTYTVQVFENVSGSTYSTALNKQISVQMSDPNSPFLRPNQFCNFNSASAAMAMSDTLTSGISDPIKKVEAVYKFAVDNITYDYHKAATVQSGYLPNIDNTLSSKTGICFDYASLITAMLRAQDVPTKLVIGYTGNVYHAWISVYTKQEGWIDNVIYFDGTSWKFMDATFAASGKGDPAITEYINNQANYQAKFSY